ncbi:hypothetical protein GYMLUDRAFT_51095 [Collybiopsis luxurians FD-317 M1]|uniref:Uncharacterized protein n=1 Tax=Collybiopsis luxurians FD-317 M1 TaxID=944289 RepID=A0A0D0AK75_9AGAR|nr:hypothetical protein GYMLUDRAFT_51095 [Collybiopsis luxurians FD-317 M1]
MTKLVKPHPPSLETTKPVSFPYSSDGESEESADEKRPRKSSLLKVTTQATKVAKRLNLLKRSVSFHAHRSPSHDVDGSKPEPSPPPPSLPKHFLSPHRHRRVSLPSLPAFLHRRGPSSRRSSSLELDSDVPSVPSALSPIPSAPPSAVEAASEEGGGGRAAEVKAIDWIFRLEDSMPEPSACPARLSQDSLGSLGNLTSAAGQPDNNSDTSEAVIPAQTSDFVPSFASPVPSLVPCSSTSSSSSSSHSPDLDYNYMDDIDDFYPSSSSHSEISEDGSCSSSSDDSACPSGSVLIASHWSFLATSSIRGLHRPIPLGFYLTWWLGLSKA